jgi:hypothetical protein
MAENSKKRKFSVIWLVPALVLLTTAAVVMILLGYTPGIYQPYAIPPSGQVNPYLTHKLGPDFFTGMQSQQPFELVLEQRGVNEMLALTTDTMTFGDVTLSSPDVVFYSDSIVLMAVVKLKDISSVLSITAQPVMEKDGRLNLNIRSATLGAVPVMGLVRRIGRQIADEYLAGQDEKEFAGIANSVLDNKPFEPVISVSKYTMRLKTLTLENGKVTLLIEPVKDRLRISGPKVP